MALDKTRKITLKQALIMHMGEESYAVVLDFATLDEARECAEMIAKFYTMQNLGDHPAAALYQ